MRFILSKIKKRNSIFIIFQGLSLKQLTQQILPLASHYSITVRFVKEKVLPEDGQVNHALRGALHCLLRDYLVCFIIRQLNFFFNYKQK